MSDEEKGATVLPPETEGCTASAGSAKEIERAVYAHRRAAEKLNADADDHARTAPVVEITASGARIVQVSKGWVIHPDDRGALMKRRSEEESPCTRMTTTSTPRKPRKCTTAGGRR